MLIWASFNGLTDLVNRFLQDDRVDPLAQNCTAMLLACLYDRKEVVEVLIKDKRSKSISE
jgi:hypothetical protein